MAVIFVEGFDAYNGVSTSGTSIGMNSFWNVPAAGTAVLGAGRFGGQAFRYTTQSTSTFNRSFTATSSFTVGFASYVTTLTTNTLVDQDCFLILKSGSTYMIGLKASNTGQLSVVRMSAIGTITILGSTASNVMVAATWQYIELSVTISDTLGTVDLRVNGQSVLSLTNQDTRNGTPTTVDTVEFFGSGSNARGGAYNIDDLYITDSLTPLGEQKIETLRPSADTAQKQLVPGEKFELGVNTTASTTAFATKGDIFNCNANVTLNSVTSYFGAVAQNVKLGVARLTSANPGTVAEILYESDTTSLSAVAGNYKFSVPDIAFTNGNVYAVYFTRTDGVGTTILSVPFPSTAAPTITDQAGTLTWNSGARVADNNIGVSDSLFFSTTSYMPMTLGLTGFSASNYSVIDSTFATTTGFVSSNTVGNYDLYDFVNLSSTANSISAVQVSALAGKDNVGVRAIAPVVKSGSSTTDGANTYLGVGYTWSTRILDTDPNTSAAWTASGVNAIQAGVKVTI